MSDIAILTPDPADQDHRGRWREVLARAAAPLEAAGLKVEARSWVEAGDLRPFRLVLPLLVWGYVRALPHWLDAVAGWDAAGVRLMNPPSVLGWNGDKAYLGRLERKGAPVLPTRFVERVTREEMEQAAEAFGVERLVAKPRVSASAWRTIRWSAGASLEGGPDGPAMIQPYLPAIETEGELSLLFFGGRFSHAIRKVPQRGDFRVQPEYDGVISAHAPAEDEMEAARAALAAVEEPLLYARVDLVRGLDTRPRLIELELIEPDLYLGHDPQRGAAFAEAVRSALD